LWSFLSLDLSSKFMSNADIARLSSNV